MPRRRIRKRVTKRLPYIILSAFSHSADDVWMYDERAFSVAAPRLWNKLPLQIRLSDHLRQFLRPILRLIFLRVHLICSFLTCSFYFFICKTIELYSSVNSSDFNF